MSSVEPESRQLVVFALGNEEYALPIDVVQEVIRYSEPRDVAADSPWLRGVISLRGKIVPVCDLAARLRLPSERFLDPKIVILELGAGTVGVIVDRVEEVLTIQAAELEPVPTATTELIEGIAKIGDRLVVLLAPESLLDDERLAA